MAKNIFLFSGQGSQYVGMAKDLYDNFDGAKKIFETANIVLGYDLKSIVFDALPKNLIKQLIHSLQ